MLFKRAADRVTLVAIGCPFNEIFGFLMASPTGCNGIDSESASLAGAQAL
jgi:hypothetical protein